MYIAKRGEGTERNKKPAIKSHPILSQLFRSNVKIEFTPIAEYKYFLVNVYEDPQIASLETVAEIPKGKKGSLERRKKKKKKKKPFKKGLAPLILYI